MTTQYTNLLTGPIVMSSGGVPLTDIQTLNPVAYVNATIRQVLTFTTTAATSVAVTLPRNFVALPSACTFHLQGAASGGPQNVSVSAGATAGATDLASAVNYTSDGAVTLVWTSTGTQYLVGEVQLNANPTRTFYVNATATTAGTSPSHIFIYIPGIYVDLTDIAFR